jgi:hypothetical protein
MDRKKTASFGEALERYLADTPLAEGLRYSRVCQAWKDTVGESVSKFCSGYKFEGGILTVRLTSSVLRMQLEMSRETIREQLNNCLGSDMVKSLKLR